MLPVDLHFCWSLEIEIGWENPDVSDSCVRYLDSNLSCLIHTQLGKSRNFFTDRIFRSGGSGEFGSDPRASLYTSTPRVPRYGVGRGGFYGCFRTV